MSDEELIIRIKKGEKQAFKLLVERYHVRVINTCLGMLHIREDAEDVAQEVFMEVFRSLPKFRKESKFSTWLYRIAINKSLNFLRKSKIRKRIQTLDTSSSTKSPVARLAAQATNPAEALENVEKSKILHNTLDSLPENQKVAFTLHNYEGLPYKEIAEIMKMSLSAVESLMYRAKMNLQKKLMAYYKDYR